MSATRSTPRGARHGTSAHARPTRASPRCASSTSSHADARCPARDTGSSAPVRHDLAQTIIETEGVSTLLPILSDSIGAIMAHVVASQTPARPFPMLGKLGDNILRDQSIGVIATPPLHRDHNDRDDFGRPSRRASSSSRTRSPSRPACGDGLRRSPSFSAHHTIAVLRALYRRDPAQDPA